MTHRWRNDDSASSGSPRRNKRNETRRLPKSVHFNAIKVDGERERERDLDQLSSERLPWMMSVRHDDAAWTLSPWPWCRECISGSSCLFLFFWISLNQTIKSIESNDHRLGKFDWFLVAIITRWRTYRNWLLITFFFQYGLGLWNMQIGTGFYRVSFRTKIQTNFEGSFLGFVRVWGGFRGHYRNFRGFYWVFTEFQVFQFNWQTFKGYSKF